MECTLGTRGFSRVRREFSVLAEGQHIFGRRPKPRAAKPREKRAGHYKDLTETGNLARKVSGTQGKWSAARSRRAGKKKEGEQEREQLTPTPPPLIFLVTSLCAFPTI